MPAFAIRLYDEKQRKTVFLIWSTVVDAPTSYVMETEEELQETACMAYGGESDWPIHDGFKYVIGNRAGPNETDLTCQQVIERYRSPETERTWKP